MPWIKRATTFGPEHRRVVTNEFRRLSLVVSVCRKACMPVQNVAVWQTAAARWFLGGSPRTWQSLAAHGNDGQYQSTR